MDRSIEQILRESLRTGRRPRIPHLKWRHRRAYERAAIRHARKVHQDHPGQQQERTGPIELVPLEPKRVRPSRS